MWQREPLNSRTAWLRPVGSAAAAVIVAFLYSVGWLDFVEAQLDALRFRSTDRSASGTLVIVTIDPPSLLELGVWPWPRTVHAVALRRLKQAGARQIGIDIDFSSASTVDSDEELQRALKDADDRVLLPVFKQINETAHGPELHVVAPLPMFQTHAELASVNVTPDADGVVRRINAIERVGDTVLPTFAVALIAGPQPSVQPYGIDFSIDPGTLPRISFADVYTGRFDPAMVKGKTVLIGATAIELGDQIAVPVYSTLSGVLIHGLAYETLIADRAIHRPPPAVLFGLCMASALVICAGCRSRSWRRDGLVLIVFCLSIVAASTALFRFQPILLDTTPVLVVAAAVFGLMLVSRIDEQALQLWFERLHLMRVDTLLQRIVEDSFDGILVIGANSRILRGNGAAARIFGLEAGQLAGLHVSGLIADHQLTEVGGLDAYLLKPGTHEFACTRSDGESLMVEISISRIQIGRETMVVGIVRDVSARKRHEAHLEYIAHHDTLTDLPNRLQMDCLIGRSIVASEAAGVRFAVLILDLDRFKDVNDALGHATGDSILKEVAARFRRSLRLEDHIARLAGDQFCVLAAGVRDAEGADEAAQRMLAHLETPVRINGIAIEIGATVGIAFYPGDGTDAATLLRCADIALQRARKTCSRISAYDASKDRTSLRNLAFASDLRRAIANHELVLAYQPKIELSSRSVCGAEALVRWRHPKHGYIPPDEFIGQAEVTGLIRPLTYWILQEGISALSDLHRRDMRICMSLNLSTKNLFDADLPIILRSIIDNVGIDPKFIVLEITENAMMHDQSRAIETADRLRANGFGLSIDDFGTGYSSLAYLQRLPVKELKIDKSFVMNMHNNRTDLQIVKSTIALAHALDLRVVAEGIELPQHLDVLIENACDMGQGYLFSRPLLFADLTTWLAAWSGTPQRQTSQAS